MSLQCDSTISLCILRISPKKRWKIKRSDFGIGNADSFALRIGNRAQHGGHGATDCSRRSTVAYLIAVADFLGAKVQKGNIFGRIHLHRRHERTKIKFE